MCVITKHTGVTTLLEGPCTKGATVRSSPRWPQRDHSALLVRTQESCSFSHTL